MDLALPDRWTTKISSLNLLTSFWCRDLQNSSSSFSYLSHKLVGSICALILVASSDSRSSFQYCKTILIENIDVFCHNAFVDMITNFSQTRKNVTFETLNRNFMIGFTESNNENHICSLEGRHFDQKVSKKCFLLLHERYAIWGSSTRPDSQKRI